MIDNTEEEILYQVVEITENSVFLQNVKNNVILEEKNLEEEFIKKIDIDTVLIYKNGEYIVDEVLTQKFMDSLISIKEYNLIKQKFIQESNITQIESDTIFTIKEKGNEYSILVFIVNKNQKEIKVPNPLIPFFAEENDKLCYKNGKFNIV